MVSAALIWTENGSETENKMGIMSKFKKAKASGGAFKYFEEGEHIVQVNSVKQFEDRNDNEAVAFDAIVLHTSSPIMRAGETRNWMVSESNADVYASNVKAMLMAVHNMTEDEMNEMGDAEFEELCGLTFGEQQAAAGVILKVISVKTRKKHAKKLDWSQCKPDDVFTKHALEFLAPVGSKVEIVNGQPVISKP